MTRFVTVVAVAAFVIATVLPVFADEPVEGRNGRAELRFLEGMIDHHQMALDMANDCLANAETEDVLTLCENIITAQSAEIELMRGWLLDWYNTDYTPVSMLAEPEAGDAMADMEHSAHTAGPNVDPPMMMGMMAGLNRLEGQAYEVAWLESMVDHHDDALHMSERVLERAEHDELITLARAIISDQSAEIEYMETLLVNLEP